MANCDETNYNITANYLWSADKWLEAILEKVS